MGKIIVAGKEFEVDAKVVTWRDDPSYDAHQLHCVASTRRCPNGGVWPFSEKKPVQRAHRFSARPQLRRRFGRGIPPLAAVQGIVRQFILHHDGLASARSCFNVLHNERGLSCHFLLDNNGTIYQTLDLAYMGYHAAGFNAGSVGIEISNRGDAKRFPNFYKGKREKATCKIHNHVYLAFDYTEPQYRAMRGLVRGLSRALPNMPIDYPQESPGYQSWGQLTNPKSYAGLMGHYHTTRRKWDPGPFDFKEFCESIRGRLSFPVSVREDKPDVPDDDEQRRKDVDRLYTFNEGRDGGFFPVGPYGETRLWHGGIHLVGKAGDKVYAPFPGRLMAARMGPASPGIGSTNFVLLRHDLRLGLEAIRFYTLMFHLDDSSSATGEDAPAWFDTPGWKAGKSRGQVVLLEEPVEAGDIVGRIGMAGPADSRKPQLHIEMFATEEISDKLGGAKFQLIDGAASGRFAPTALIKPIDENKDGKLSRREVVSFFSSSADRNLARYYTTFHVSEWTAKPDWLSELARTPDFAGKKEAQLKELVTEQIDPTLWWDARVSRHAKLPPEGIVYHYNPITLIRVINDQLQMAKHETKNGKNAFDKADAKEKPDSVLGDEEDESGESFLDEDEIKEVEEGPDLTLKDLASGFPD